MKCKKCNEEICTLGYFRVLIVRHIWDKEKMEYKNYPTNDGRP